MLEVHLNILVKVNGINSFMKGKHSKKINNKNPRAKQMTVFVCQTKLYFLSDFVPTQRVVDPTTPV